MQIGVVKNVDEFWEILFEKWKQYLYRIKSGIHLVEVLGKDIESVEDLKEHFEEFKIYVRDFLVVFYVYAVNFNRAADNIVHSCDKIRNGAFSASGVTDDTNVFSGSYAKRNILENRSVCTVVEGNIFKFNFTFDIFGNLSI